MKMKKFLALFVMLAMLIGMMPTTMFTVSAVHYEDDNYVSYDDLEVSLPVTTEGKTYSLFTEENLENQDGTTFLYVIKSGDRYYTPAHPSSSVTSYTAVDSIAAVDITAYWNADTNTFANIPDSANLGVMQYQTYAGSASALYMDGDIMFSLSVPFEEDGETWFGGGIQYFRRDETYGYDRALWHANGDGSGYLYDSYIDWIGDSDKWVYGVLGLKTDALGNMRFAMRNMSDEYNELRAAHPDDYTVGVDFTAYLYAAPCGHAETEHIEYDAPTCMDKGCKEYWYCRFCTVYFADAECKTPYECKPILPALGHDYSDTECANCHNPIPQYTKITSYEQFKTIKPGASFIAVAEIDNGNGGKDYYVLKMPLNYTSADIDENGEMDILQIDENKNGTADILEVDSDGDGTADVWAFDGFFSDGPDGVLDNDEIEQYLFELEIQYTDGYMVAERLLEATQVTPESDGTINVKDLGALEFIMDRRYPDDTLDEQYYGNGETVKDYENDFYFRVPNFWVRPMVTVDNNFYNQGYEFGDSRWWGVLFGKDVKELDDYRAEQFAEYPDDSVILYTEAFDSVNGEGELEHSLRFIVNGDQKNFIITSNSAWEVPEGTQIPIYLYCSDAGEGVHEHVWSSWTKLNDEIHKRVCTVDGCTAFDLASHNENESLGCRQDTEDYTLGHWVTCTDCEGDYHEYHTRETVPGYYGRYYWRDAEDGINHVIYCTKCGGPAEYAEHVWGQWYYSSRYENNDYSTPIWGHRRTCQTWPCEAEQWSYDCVYDEGIVTKEPTCLETGLKTYTCLADDCQFDTKTYTEEIPALDHDWGEWQATDDPTKEQRVCNRDASHIEERTTHDHIWDEWVDDEVSETHTRKCTFAGCSATETEPHNWDDGVQSGTANCTEGATVTFTCTDCSKTRNETGDPLGHDWGDWTYDSVDSHTRSCKRNCGVEEEFEGHSWGEWTAYDDDTHRMTCSICLGYQEGAHDWDNGVETTPATCYSTGVMTYTCGTCGHIKTEQIPMTEHSFTDWVPDGDENHKRECMDENCDAFETLPHAWDDGEVTTEPTCTEKGVKTYTCQTCQHTITEDIPMVDHEWTDWEENGDGTHSRSCRCNANETKDCTYGDGVVTKQPTHYEEGVKTFTCTVCGHTKTEAIAKTTEHEWSDWAKKDDQTHIRECKCGETETASHSYNAVVTAPTCTERGYTTHTCATCSDSFVDSYVDAIGHDTTNTVYDIGKESTCLTPGVRGHYKCESCGGLFLMDNAVDPLRQVTAEELVTPAHTLTDVAEVKPTCTADGVKAHKKCEGCIKYFIDGVEVTASDLVLAATGHSYESVVTAPTCTEKGYTTHTCATCGSAYTDTYVDALGHAMGEWQQTKAPACEEKGEQKRQCARCDYAETRAVDAVGHSYTAKVTAPTCTEKGYTTHTCGNCGAAYTSDHVEALGHKHEAVVTAPTCTKGGYTTYTCHCGDTYIADPTEATGHSWDDGVVTKEPTTEAEGVKTYTCRNCSETKTEALPKKPGVNYDVPEDDTVAIPENDCFEVGTTVTVEVITEGILFNQVAEVMEDVAESYVAYEFTATKDNVAVQPDGKLAVTFAIPEGYGTNVIVYYMAEDGTLEELECVVDPETRTVTAELEHFSTYIVVDCDTAPAVLLGDVNGDGRINTGDAKLIMQYELRLIDESRLNLAAADVNGDGKVNTGDAKLIMQFELGIITEFPVAK